MHSPIPRTHAFIRETAELHHSAPDPTNARSSHHQPGTFGSKARYGAREGSRLQLTLVSHRRLVKLASFTSSWTTSSATPLSTSCSTSWRGSAPASTPETSPTPTSSSSRRTWKVRLASLIDPFSLSKLTFIPPPQSTTNLIDAVAGEVEDSLGKWPSALGTVVVMEAKYIPFLLFKVMPLLPASARHEPKRF